MGPTPHYFPKTHPKPTQVQPGPISAVCIHQHGIRPEHWHGTPCPPRSVQLSMTAERLPVITGTPSSEVAMPVGPHDFLGKTDHAGASPHASCSVHASRPMVTVIGPPLLPVRITPELLPVLRWWSLPANLTSGVPLHQPLLELPLFTDAFSEGWGAYLLSHQRGGLWDSIQKHLHINVLELLATRLALQQFLPLVQGQPVMVMIENTTVIAQLCNQGGCCQGPFMATLLKCCFGPTVSTST